MDDQEPEELARIRETTDSSLHDERDRSDAEHARARDTARAETDERIRIYRARNAALLRALRDLSDQTDTGRSAAQHEAVASLRRSHDQQRAAAETTSDEVHERERERSRRTLAAILESERAETDRLLEQERLRADEFLESRDEFLGVVAHDLRNFLSNISTWATVIEQTGEAQATQAARHIKSTTTQMALLVSDLLDVSAIEANALRLDRSEHDLTALIRDVVASFGPLATQRGLELAARVPDRSVLARLDPARMIQVLGNLLSNATRFTPSGGRIDVEVTAQDDGHRIAVRDTGCGIPTAEIDTIFERFKHSTEKGHHGLGLCIARGIVVSHGGEIWAESEVDKGTSICFTIPGSAKSPGP